MKRLTLIGLFVALLLISCGTPTTAAPTQSPPTEPPPTAAPPTDTPPASPTAAPATLAPGDTPPASATAGPPTDTPPPAPTDTPAASPTPATVFITYKDFQIVPASITIKVGTTVVFLIEAGFLVSHQPYNFNAPNTFESPANLGNGKSWPYTFNEPGTVTIRCGYHSEMVGTIVVEP